MAGAVCGNGYVETLSDAVQTVIPHAQIVIDKFHVVRMANDALERVRKSLRGQLTAKQRRGLMHDRFILLKRERDLTDTEIPAS